MNTFDMKLFHHNAKDKYFSAEASDLTEGGTKTLHGHNGSFMMKSSSGHEAMFECAVTKRDEEGDIMYWEFWPTSNAKMRHPKLAGYVVTVFND